MTGTLIRSRYPGRLYGPDAEGLVDRHNIRRLVRPQWRMDGALRATERRPLALSIVRVEATLCSRQRGVRAGFSLVSNVVTTMAPRRPVPNLTSASLACR